MKDLLSKLETKKARVGVMGMGYVGLPVAVEFAGKGFNVTGFDISKKKIETINKGKSITPDIADKTVKDLVKRKILQATDRANALRKCDAILICVPTPLNRVKEPDMSFVISAVNTIKPHLRKGQLIILESTTYPGTTEELVLPELSATGLKAGKDFFLCFSPERIDPGNEAFPLAKIPTVIGGITHDCSTIGAALYRHITPEVKQVSSTNVAEFTKLLENTFRIVNIGLINELAVVSEKLGVNIWEAVDAAKTKPFGYMPFYPGPGIGGHCIGIDPLYLSWKARLTGGEIRFVEIASRVNAAMPSYVVKRAAYALNQCGKTLSRAKVLLLGVSYKRDVGDTRESPALEIIKELNVLGSKVEYHDPWVKELCYEKINLKSINLTAAKLKQYDLAILVTDHTDVDYTNVLKHVPKIMDTRNALKHVRSRKKIVLL